MNYKPWTLALIGAGLVSLPAVTNAEEKASSAMTAVSGTTISGYVNTSAWWVPGSTPNTAAYSFGGFGAKGDGFNLDVVDLTISKPLDEGAWGAGYKAEMWFG